MLPLVTAYCLVCPRTSCLTSVTLCFTHSGTPTSTMPIMLSVLPKSLSWQEAEASPNWCPHPHPHMCPDDGHAVPPLSGSTYLPYACTAASQLILLHTSTSVPPTCPGDGQAALPPELRDPVDAAARGQAQVRGPQHIPGEPRCCMPMPPVIICHGMCSSAGLSACHFVFLCHVFMSLLIHYAHLPYHVTH